MKLLFVHETKLKEDKEGNYYTSGSFSQDVWNRYLSIADELNVIARKEDKLYDIKIAQESFNYFDKTKMNFIEVPSKVKSIRAFFDLNNNKKIKEIINKQVKESDAVIVRLPSIYGDIAAEYAKECNKPFLVEVVGCAWDSLWNYSWIGKIYAFKRLYNTRKTILKAPYVIYVTNNYLQRRYPTNGINTGCSNVTLSDYDEKIIEKRLKKIKSMSRDRKVIIGTISAVDVKYKGQRNVIRALGQLKNEGVLNFEYHLVGGGEQIHLSELAKKYNVLESIKFIGSLPHYKISEWLDNIDIYIQPSLTEGLPRALIEAMSRGTPSIGTDAGGIPELLDSSCIYKKNNYKEIVAMLKKHEWDEDWYLENANRNFETSRQYHKTIIENKRLKMLSNLASTCNIKNL